MPCAKESASNDRERVHHSTKLRGCTGVRPSPFGDQALAVNEDGISNDATNPAALVSIVTLYATCDGQLGADAIDGKPYGAAKTPYSVSVDFGGYSGEVLYAGRAPGYIGLMQINVRIPSRFVPSGDVPLTLTVRGQASQNGVTLNIR